jgi:hypothetical protein
MLPVMQREDGTNGNVGEKLAQPKKNSYDHIREKDEKETIQSNFTFLRCTLCFKLI